MTRFTVLFGIMLLTVGLLACGGSSPAAAPTAPPVAAVAPSGGQQQSAPASQPVPSSEEEAVNLAAEVPRQLRGSDPAPPAWPTFTPGPKPQSTHRLLYARTYRFYTAGADGSDSQPLELSPKPPQLLTVSYKDAGRGWLSPNGRSLLYFAGQEGQLWLANLDSLENVLLAERMIPPGLEGDADAIRILTDQEMTWTGDGASAALVGASDSVDLYIVDIASAQLSRVTQDDLREIKPRWSPAGKYLAYLVSDMDTGTQAMYVLDADTRQPTEIDLGPVRDALALEPTIDLLFSDQFVWATDTQLIFYPSTGTGEKPNGIWVYDLVSGVARPILTNKITDTVWSAEARAWVYSTTDEPGKLWMIRLDDPKPITLVEADAYAPVWSPDGQSVLYSSGDSESAPWDLNVVDLNGNSYALAESITLIQRETSEPGPAGKRYWIPGGESVLFATVGRDYGRAERSEGYGGDAGPDLENWWAAPAGGGQPRQITDLQKVFYLQEPALSPDGAVWAFMGFSYTDRMQHLYTMLRGGSHPQKVDAGVRWFEWLP
ncbi:MAG: hypothetical protein ACE5HA_10640 [Anaerolineae bacterium]